MIFIDSRESKRNTCLISIERSRTVFLRRSAGDVSVPASGHSLNEVMPAGMVSAISEAIRNRSPQKTPRAGFARHRALERIKNYPFALFLMYWSMALAAALPAPMALMTVAAPVTASPPA